MPAPMFLPQSAAMLSIDFIRNNRPVVERAIQTKGVDLDLGALLSLDAEARALKTGIDNERAARNAISARFKDAAPEEKAKLGAEAKAAGARASQLESELAEKEAAEAAAAAAAELCRAGGAGRRGRRG